MLVGRCFYIETILNGASRKVINRRIVENISQLG